MRELYDEKIALKKLKEIEYIVCETEAEQREGKATRFRCEGC